MNLVLNFFAYLLKREQEMNQTFSQYRDSLSAKRYDPLPREEANSLAIQKKEKDKLAESCQRLIVKAINKKVRMNECTDDLLFELIQVGNEAIANSIAKYNQPTRDFALFCYVNIINAIISYLRRYTHIIRRTKIDGEYHYATYVDLCQENEDGEVIEIADEIQLEMDELDLELVYSQLPKVKQRAWDIFICRWGLLDQEVKTDVEVARIYGMTGEAVRASNRRTMNLIRNNKELMNYFSRFL
jgi:RNA polymerase sigma factor (sigma-70 family)